jgi:protein-disulfide reductase (glutathione)
MPQTRRTRRATLPLLALLSLFGTLGAPKPAHAGGDWNDAGIAWRSYADGLAEAQKAGKPICLIVFTEWCPHCKNYSAVFHDAKVVEMSKRFVMIRLDQDQNKDLLKNFGPDGQYIPRTFFLSSDGKLDADLRAPREPYRYFYDEAKAEGSAGVLVGMQKALDKLAAK